MDTKNEEVKTAKNVGYIKPYSILGRIALFALSAILIIISVYLSSKLGFVDAFISAFLSGFAGYILTKSLDTREQMNNRIKTVLPIFRLILEMKNNIADVRPVNLSSVEAIEAFLGERVKDVFSVSGSITSNFTMEENEILKKELKHQMGSDVEIFFDAQKQHEKFILQEKSLIQIENSSKKLSSK